MMKTLILSLLLSQQCLNMDIMVVGDYSGSIGGHEHQVKLAISRFARRFEDSPGVRVGVQLFNSGPIDVYGLTYNKRDLADSVLTLGISPQGDTYMTLALVNAFSCLTQDRFQADKVVIFISDGQPTEGYDLVLQKARELKKFGVIIFTIAVGDIDSFEFINFLEDMSSYDKTTRTGLDEIVATLQRLEICL